MGPVNRVVIGLGACMELLLLYVAWFSGRPSGYLPGEEVLLSAMGAWLLPAARPTLRAATEQDLMILRLWMTAIPLCLLHAGAVWIVWKKKLGAVDWRLVLAFGFLFRMTLVPTPPILETDHHRYLWDGAVTWAGVNPYVHPPASVQKFHEVSGSVPLSLDGRADLAVLARLSQTPELAPHHERINHPEIPTIYPPLAQALFAAASALAPGSIAFLKLLVVLTDLGVLAMVVLLLLRLGQDPSLSILHAWCPLVLKEYANTGHYDPLATVFLLACLHLLLLGRRVSAGVCLGAGILARLYPLIALPLFLRRLGPRGVLASFLTVLVGYAPFLSGGGRIFRGLGAFARDWEFNSSLVSLVEKTFIPLFPDNPPLATLMIESPGSSAPAWFVEVPLDAFLLAKSLCGLLLLGFILLLILRDGTGDTDEGLLRQVALVLGATLLLSPVSDPWYLGWVLPLACLFPTVAILYLSWGMFVYYLYFLNWDYLPWARALEYVPFSLLLAWEGRRFLRRLVT